LIPAEEQTQPETQADQPAAPPEAQADQPEQPQAEPPPQKN